MNIPQTPQHNPQLTQPDALHRVPGGAVDPRDAALLGDTPATRTAAAINRILADAKARFATPVDMSALVVGSYRHRSWLLAAVDELVLDLAGTTVAVRCVRTPFGRSFRYTAGGRVLTGAGDLRR